MFALIGMQFDYCDHYGYVKFPVPGDQPACDKCGIILSDYDIQILKDTMREHIRASQQPDHRSEDALRQTPDQDVGGNGAASLLRTPDEKSQVRGET